MTKPESDPLDYYSRFSDPLEAFKEYARAYPRCEPWVAAWEKERAGHMENFAYFANDLLRMKAAVERIEGQARRAYDQSIQTYGATYAQDELRIFADALRAAREPNRPQEDSDGESA